MLKKLGQELQAAVDAQDELAVLVVFNRAVDYRQKVTNTKPYDVLEYKTISLLVDTLGAFLNRVRPIPRP